MAPDVPPLRLLRGDEAELFRTHEVALRAVVSHHVNATKAVVEDACAFAWLQLMRQQPNRKTVFPWLRTVAIREAWRLDHVARRTVDIDTVDEDDLPQYQDTSTIDAHRLLRTVRDLSPHQRRVLLLFVSGHPYKEIAARHDLSATAINKALVRARRHLRLVHDPS